jgi:hypothetical protein
MSDEDMHLWAMSNYFPLHQQVAPGDPDHVALAIGIVLTEFERCRPPFPFGREAALRAIDLIRSSSADFDSRRSAFLLSAAPPKNAP